MGQHLPSMSKALRFDSPTSKINDNKMALNILLQLRLASNIHKTIQKRAQLLTMIPKKQSIWGWRDGSEFQSACCSCIVSEFDSQPPVTPRDLMPPASMCTQVHNPYTQIHIIKNKIFFKVGKKYMRQRQDVVHLRPAVCHRRLHFSMQGEAH